MTASRIPDALLDAIRDRIRLSDFIGEHVTLKRHGREHVGCCPFHQDRHPSFCVSNSKGIYKCFSCGESGDVITFAQRIYRLDFRQAVDALASDNGLSEMTAIINPAVSERAAKRRLAEEAERLKYRQAALRIWSETIPADGTPVEDYLRTRAIDIPMPAAIRYHPEARYKSGDKTFLVLPAMISAFTNVAGEITAIHRTYLKRNGSGKADVPKPKSILGEASGSAVHLFDPPSVSTDTVNVTEGIETGLSLRQLNGYLTLAAGSTSGIVGLHLPPLPFGKRIIIGADNDANDAGVKAAETAAARWRAGGREVEISAPRSVKDWNDYVRGRSLAEQLDRPMIATGISATAK